jgi:polyisoprenoid-binding protein YceI
LRFIAVSVFAVVLAPAAFSQHQTFIVNPDASQVTMTLNTTHEVVHGVFHVQSGSVAFDPGAPLMSGSIAVAAGGKTGDDSRDRKMYKDVLKVSQYANISFAPRTYAGVIAPSGDSNIQVTGTFTLLGTPHEITVPIEVHRDGSSATASAHFTVPYVQWGLKNPSFLIWKAENDVAVDLNLVGTISK